MYGGGRFQNYPSVSGRHHSVIGVERACPCLFCCPCPLYHENRPVAVVGKWVEREIPAGGPRIGPLVSAGLEAGSKPAAGGRGHLPGLYLVFSAVEGRASSVPRML